MGNDLFTTVVNGGTYTCHDKEAYSWEKLDLDSRVDLSGQRVTVMMIDPENRYACVELVSDRRKNFDVKIDSLKK